MQLDGIWRILAHSGQIERELPAPNGYLGCRIVCAAPEPPQIGSTIKDFIHAIEQIDGEFTRDHLTDFEPGTASVYLVRLRKSGFIADTGKRIKPAKGTKRLIVYTLANYSEPIACAAD